MARVSHIWAKQSTMQQGRPFGTVWHTRRSNRFAGSAASSPVTLPFRCGVPLQLHGSWKLRQPGAGMPRRLQHLHSLTLLATFLLPTAGITTFDGTALGLLRAVRCYFETTLVWNGTPNTPDGDMFQAAWHYYAPTHERTLLPPNGQPCSTFDLHVTKPKVLHYLRDQIYPLPTTNNHF